MKKQIRMAFKFRSIQKHLDANFEGNYAIPVVSYGYYCKQDIHNVWIFK